MDNIHHLNHFQTIYKLHKENDVVSDFGLDNRAELFQDCFGIYSSAGLKENIGPFKAQYYRIGLGLQGNIKIDSSIKSVTHFSPFISFTIPGQVFSIYDKSEDYFSYYILFSEKFIQDAMSLKNILEDFPFIINPNLQTFCLNETEATGIKYLFLEINKELKNNHSNTREVIQLHINLILFTAKRSLERQSLISHDISNHLQLIVHFRKLIKIHFLEHQPLSFYAEKLCVSIQHLNRISKATTEKTAHELIDEMMLIEAKILLKHSKLSVNEIANKLKFNDSSYFVRFFRKMTGQTPSSYR